MRLAIVGAAALPWPGAGPLRMNFLGFFVALAEPEGLNFESCRLDS